MKIFLFIELSKQFTRYFIITAADADAQSSSSLKWKTTITSLLFNVVYSNLNSGSIKISFYNLTTLIPGLLLNRPFDLNGTVF